MAEDKSVNVSDYKENLKSLLQRNLISCEVFAREALGSNDVDSVFIVDSVHMTVGSINVLLSIGQKAGLLSDDELCSHQSQLSEITGQLIKLKLARDEEDKA